MPQQFFFLQNQSNFISINTRAILFSSTPEQFCFLQHQSNFVSINTRAILFLSTPEQFCFHQHKSNSVSINIRAVLFPSIPEQFWSLQFLSSSFCLQHLSNSVSFKSWAILFPSIPEQFWSLQFLSNSVLYITWAILFPLTVKLLALLFAEEVGLILETKKQDAQTVQAEFRTAGVDCYLIGSSAASNAATASQVWHYSCLVYDLFGCIFQEVVIWENTMNEGVNAIKTILLSFFFFGGGGRRAKCLCILLMGLQH